MINKEKKFEVDGCIDCPFCYEFDMSPGYGCRISERLNSEDKTIKQDKSKWLPVTPDWCPLKIENITVKMKNH